MTLDMVTVTYAASFVSDSFTFAVGNSRVKGLYLTIARPPLSDIYKNIFQTPAMLRIQPFGRLRRLHDSSRQQRDENKTAGLTKVHSLQKRGNRFDLKKQSGPN
jgi:hypothetical protein